MDIESTYIRAKQLPVPKVTICALLYGDHFDLAQRCLGSIARLPRDSSWELRIAENQISDRTKLFVTQFSDKLNRDGVNVLGYSSSENRGKYPMMRRMLYDPLTPIASEYVMWFDDDSYLLGADSNWLSSTLATAARFDMIGAVASCPYVGNQAAWIKTQPWYKGKEPEQIRPGQYKIGRFVLGGWWVAKMKMLRALDWPPTTLYHRGGDTMLGEAMRQNDYTIGYYDAGVAINADHTGKSHVSPRRGLDPKPIGWDYEPTLTMSVHLATATVPDTLLDYPGL